MDASQAYHDSMLLIRNRLETIAALPSDAINLVRAEQVAFQVRKIVEGVAYAALSAVEVRNAQQLRELRTRDADKLLTFLNAKGMLRLPQAQRIEQSPDPTAKLQLNGHEGLYDLSLDQLKSAFSRASAMVHERHPERLDADRVAAELSALLEDARLLREWLWLNIMFFGASGFLVQMGQAGSDSFMVNISKLEGGAATDALRPHAA